MGKPRIPNLRHRPARNCGPLLTASGGIDLQTNGSRSGSLERVRSGSAGPGNPDPKIGRSMEAQRRRWKSLVGERNLGGGGGSRSRRTFLLLPLPGRAAPVQSLSRSEKRRERRDNRRQTLQSPLSEPARSEPTSADRGATDRTQRLGSSWQGRWRRSIPGSGSRSGHGVGSCWEKVSSRSSRNSPLGRTGYLPVGPRPAFL